MKKILLLLIKSYQATRLLRLPSCRFYPSCSEYAKLSIEKHGVGRGLVLSSARLLRCHPFCAGGIDLVPDKVCWKLGSH